MKREREVPESLRIILAIIVTAVMLLFILLIIYGVVIAPYLFIT